MVLYLCSKYVLSLFTAYKLKAFFQWSVLSNDALSISAARSVLSRRELRHSIVRTHYLTNMHYSKVISIFWLANVAECRFWPLGGFETGSDVISWQSNHGCIFVFHWHFLCIFYSFDVTSTFRLAENSELTFSAARGMLVRKWRQHSIPLPRFCVSVIGMARKIFHRSNFFDFLCLTPIENFGDVIFIEKKFIDGTPMASPWVDPRRLSHPSKSAERSTCGRGE